MNKILEKVKETYKRANKERRLAMAKKYGFNTTEEFLAYLEGKEVTEVTSTVKPKIHIVNLLDNSGSMNGPKFRNAYEAICNEVEELKKVTDVEYTYSLYNFNRNDRPNKEIGNVPVNKVYIPDIEANTSTPLYDTINTLASDLLSNIDSDTKVLVKIFTDGQNNKGGNALLTSQNITEMEAKGITVTFVGTKEDVTYVIRTLGIEASNTLVHDNTDKGVKEAFDTTMRATTTYTKNVVEGKDVSKGFYKNLK